MGCVTLNAALCAVDGDFWNTCRAQFHTEYDYLVSLVRAFRDKGCESVLIDDRRMEFQLKATDLAHRQGLLALEIEGSDEAQYTAYVYRLTDLGKKVILDPAAPNEFLVNLP